MIAGRRTDRLQKNTGGGNLRGRDQMNRCLAVFGFVRTGLNVCTAICLAVIHRMRGSASQLTAL